MTHESGDARNEQTSWFGSLLSEAKAKTVAAIVAGVFALLALIGLAIWARTEIWLTGQITSAVEQEIGKRTSTLTKAIDKEVAFAIAEKDNDVEKIISQKIEDAFSRRIGNIVVGSFFLSGSAPQQKIFVYAPEKHKVTLYLKVSKLNESERVVIVSPWKSMSFPKDGLFHQDLDPAQVAQSFVNNSQLDVVPPDELEFNHFYEITFKITRDDVEPIESVAGISYLAVVSPSIQAVQ